jgi:3-oxoacyl-[acyl-carrier protein] reductase
MLLAHRARLLTGDKVQLRNKVTLITGASRGIGKATALKFAREGARVVVCDLDDAVVETVAEIRLRGGTATGFSVDVTKPLSIEAMVSGVLATFGCIDVLVNSAGIVADAQIRKMSNQQFDQVIDVNLKGTYNCTKAVIEAMISKKIGVVLNASSIVGMHINQGQTGYAVSRLGVIGMGKTWAREFGPLGIRVNVVCPGLIESPVSGDIPERVMRALVERVPLGRLGKPEDIANTFAFLASDEASYINGAVIEVSGGMKL